MARPTNRSPVTVSLRDTSKIKKKLESILAPVYAEAVKVAAETGAMEMKKNLNTLFSVSGPSKRGDYPAKRTGSLQASVAARTMVNHHNIYRSVFGVISDRVLHGIKTGNPKTDDYTYKKHDTVPFTKRGKESGERKLPSLYAKYLAARFSAKNPAGGRLMARHVWKAIQKGGKTGILGQALSAALKKFNRPSQVRQTSKMIKGLTKP